MAQRVIGIDPGYDRCGIAVVERGNTKESVLFSDCISTSKEDTPADRLYAIALKCASVIDTYHPDTCAIESLFFTNNQKTALRVAEARGTILTEMARRSIPVFEYSPPQIKLAITGYGKSDKKNIIDMIPRLVVISKPIAFDDEFDAIAVGLTCLAHEKIPYDKQNP